MTTTLMKLTTTLMKPCEVCKGEGVVPRDPRRLPNGEPDKFDTIDWPMVVCSTCSGSGEVPDPGPGAH